MRVLIVNNGSSSYKLAVIDVDKQKGSAPTVVLKDAGSLGYHELHDDIDELLESKIKKVLSSIDSDVIDAVGHRIVHGGENYKSAVVIDDQVEADIESLCEFAPLHNPRGLTAIRACRNMLRKVPQIAVFDTAFHSTMPATSYVYPVPSNWRKDFGIRRFGFHGISHAYCSARATEVLGVEPKSLNIVTCHLGSGCSLAAVAGGASIDTTMGFTPLEGLMMSTRSGSIDPGVLLYLIRSGKLDASEIELALNSQSGFKGLCGTADMREARRAESEGNADAKLAIDVFIHRVAQGVAAMAVSLGRLDAISFAGGIGENDSVTRLQVCEALSSFGVAIDGQKNDRVKGDVVISDSTKSRVHVIAIESREDLQIARECADTIK